jgi:aromatic-L-amino-acid/L-tryptophan decarboxylase
LPLHLHGVDAFVRALDEKLDLAAVLFRELSTIESLDAPWSPELSLVAFRPRDGTDEDTQVLLDHINSTGRMWLSSAPVRGKTYLRACILSHRSHPERIREAVEIICSAATHS